ncbi:right-handed parallel beta-helix repeat-containing protein [Candidatus Poribacteria bacterium]|nr:right-handed parallel beta-helix repeat-containing protein [Candidatus Poribacteria bacterium]
MKNSFKFTILAGVLVFLVATISQAKDIKVPGDFAKIQDALDAALIGDRILVAAGTYEENITLKSGVELLGAGADVTKIKVSKGTVITAEGVGFRTKISGFTIDGVDKSGSEDKGISFKNSSSPTISHMTITNTGGNGISCDSNSTPTIDNVTITNTGQDGISGNTTISDVTITNTGQDGISGGATISHVTITNTRRNGIYGSYSAGTISDVTITNTGEDGIYNVATISHVTITDAKGNGISGFSRTISDVTITNTGLNGISGFSHTISDVTITNTGEDGISCLSSPTISHVTITHAKGNGIHTWSDVPSGSFSKPKIRRSIISQNSFNGIKIEIYAMADLGTEAEPGGNSIFNNGNFDVLNPNPTEVKAEGNWWGEAPPNPAFFSGLVDYDPWLTKPPSDVQQ